MHLEDIVSHCQFKLGSQYRVYEDESINLRNNTQLFVIEDRTNRQIVAEFEGNIRSFSIKLGKGLDGVLRKQMLGWYVSLFQQRQTVFHLTIRGHEGHRKYVGVDSSTTLAEFTKGLDYYILYKPSQDMTKQAGVEVIKQITYELINEGYIET